MSLGAAHSSGITIVRSEVINKGGWKILYNEYSNGYVTMSAKSSQSVYAANSTVQSRFNFPDGVQLEKESYIAQASFGYNGALVRDFVIMADSGQNAKYDENGFNFTWWQTAKYSVSFMFYIEGMKKK